MQEDFFMAMTQIILDEFVKTLKTKYKNKIETLSLEHCRDDQHEYILLRLIKVKKSQREKGYGHALMSEICHLADLYSIKIKLWVTNVFGMDLKRLYMFYKKHGFVLISKANDGEMLYYNKAIKTSGRVLDL